MEMYNEPLVLGM